MRALRGTQPLVYSRFPKSDNGTIILLCAREEQRVGLVIEDFDIRERLENAHTLHENIYRKRYDFIIEKNIDSLVEFYRDIIKLGG